MDGPRKPFQRFINRLFERLVRVSAKLAFSISAALFAVPAVITTSALALNAASSAVTICDHMDCPFVGSDLGNGPSVRCRFQTPAGRTEVRAYVSAEIRCDKPIDTRKFFVLVDPPQFAGQATLRSAVYVIYPRDDGTFFSELVIGTDSPTDDGWTFTACLVLLADRGVASVMAYLATNDRSGVPARPEVAQTLDCVPLVHDPNAAT